MKNNNTIDALEACKAVLVEELRKYVESKPEKTVKCWARLPIYVDDTYGLDGYWNQNVVTGLNIDEETGVLMATFEDYDEEFWEPLDECFNVGEIAKILDSLKD